MQLLLFFAFLNAVFSNGQYSWMPIWLAELYPTRIAFLGPLFAGTLIVYFGGYGGAATIIATIYPIGLAAALFLPESKGRPLPA